MKASSRNLREMKTSFRNLRECLKTFSRNLREIEFVKIMKSSFRNLREIEYPKCFGTILDSYSKRIRQKCYQYLIN